VTGRRNTKNPTDFKPSRYNTVPAGNSPPAACPRYREKRAVTSTSHNTSVNTNQYCSNSQLR